mgnify:CR=1 FL=1|jgi:hypothetical protein
MRVLQKCLCTAPVVCQCSLNVVCKNCSQSRLSSAPRAATQPRHDREQQSMGAGISTTHWEHAKNGARGSSRQVENAALYGYCASSRPPHTRVPHLTTMPANDTASIHSIPAASVISA